MIVIDADYAKAPELPFPSSHQDAQDVILWVLKQSFANRSAITLSGLSAGGTLALSMASGGLDGALAGKIRLRCRILPSGGHDLNSHLRFEEEAI